MTDRETPSASMGAGAAPAAGMMPAYVAFGLGTLAAICWLAALLLDFQTTRWPGWARESPHAALVLAVPALVILVAQLRSGYRGALRWRATMLALLVMVLASLPGLLLVTQAQDWASLPLRIPTLGLGVALGYAVSLKRVGYGVEQQGHVVATLGGTGFALPLAPVAFVLVTTANTAARLCPPPPAQVDCGASLGAGASLEIVICGTTLLALLLALGAAALGGVIGRALGRFGG